MSFAENVQRVVDAIKDLSDNQLTHAVVESLLEQIEPIAILDIPIIKGAAVLRTRSSDSFPEFNSEKDISYCPFPEYVAIGRANKIESPIFYGSVSFVSNPSERPNLTHARSICYAETSNLWPKKEGNEYYATGMWQVEKPFRAAVIIHHDNFKQPNPHIAYLKNWYDQYIKQYSSIKEGLELFNKFMASEFAKEVPSGYRKGYITSSSFAEMLFESGYDAILYPSVKGEGSGFNIAITPKTVDNNMKFIAGIVERGVKGNGQMYCQPLLASNQFAGDKLIWKEDNKISSAEIARRISKGI